MISKLLRVLVVGIPIVFLCACVESSRDYSDFSYETDGEDRNASELSVDAAAQPARDASSSARESSSPSRSNSASRETVARDDGADASNTEASSDKGSPGDGNGDDDGPGDGGNPGDGDGNGDGDGDGDGGAAPSDISDAISRARDFSPGGPEMNPR